MSPDWIGYIGLLLATAVQALGAVMIFFAFAWLCGKWVRIYYDSRGMVNCSHTVHVNPKHIPEELR